MHFVQFDEERKGRLGTAEVIFKRQVKTEAEWSSAFRRASKAVAFLFPHRREELSEYAEYIEGLFSAKHTSAHSRIIRYDQSVRNQVGGGQNTLLTDYQRFHSLNAAILHAGTNGEWKRQEGRWTTKSWGEDQARAEKERKTPVGDSMVRRGLSFLEDECYYRHIWKKSLNRK